MSSTAVIAVGSVPPVRWVRFQLDHVVRIHMWQSCVEIEGYSATYFDGIAVFEALYH